MSAPMTERVAAGIAWLDKSHPGWRERVNVEQISFPSTRNCPLGQLGIFGTREAPQPLDAYGFNATVEDCRSVRPLAGFNALAAEWKRQLRRGA